MATILFRVVEHETGRVIIDDAEGEDAIADACASVQRTCSADGTTVTIRAVGTSEYAECRRGHRWQYLFGRSAGGWASIGETQQ